MMGAVLKKMSIAVVVCLLFADARATDFYVDADTGDDLNEGTSPDSPWRTLSNAGAAGRFSAGDRLLIKAGTEYAGQQLVIAGCRATPEAPFSVTAYGHGPKPVLNLAGSKGADGRLATVYLKNSSGIEIRGLEIQNRAGSPEATSEQQRYGLYVYARDMGEVRHIVVDSVDFFNIKGCLTKGDAKAGAGIFWYCEGDIPTYFNGFEIAHCRFENIDRIAITGNNAAGRASKWYNNINVHIHHNLIRNIGGPGITVKACDGALTEYNRVDSCGVRERGVGIWCFKTDNSVFQYNIVSNSFGATDAQGFDSDYNCTNTIYQYNMSVHNEGGFMLVCCDGSSSPKDDKTVTWNAGLKGSTIRYNLSVNDGFRERPGSAKAYFSPAFHITGDTRWTTIYGNTVIMLPKTDDRIDTNFFTFMDWGGKLPGDTYVCNNIFYAADGVTADFDGHRQGGMMDRCANTVFSNNAYIGRFAGLPADTAAVRLDADVPVFRQPEAMTGFNIDGLDYDGALAKAAAFRLLDGTPLCRGGKTGITAALYEGISALQLDYYGRSGFTGYTPKPAMDYLTNNFGTMGGRMSDFFGNDADDTKPLSIGFHNAAAQSGIEAVTPGYIRLRPAYATDYVEIPPFEGLAVIVNISGMVVGTVAGTSSVTLCDVSRLPSGMYFVRMPRAVGKFIKG